MLVWLLYQLFGVPYKFSAWVSDEKYLNILVTLY